MTNKASWIRMQNINKAEAKERKKEADLDSCNKAKQTDKQTNKQTNRQTNKKTNKQTNKEGG